MIAGIGRPYDEELLPDYEWIHANVAATSVYAGALRPTQPSLDLARLLALHRGGPREGPDPFPHVVKHNGMLWVHDGHHEWVRALLGDEQMITVRVVESGQSAE